MSCGGGRKVHQQHADDDEGHADQRRVGHEAIGQGFGRVLMDEAIRRAWAKPIERFWVHTCTFDSPLALPFYIRSGFTPYLRMVEVHDDPRLLAAAKAPH